MITTNKEGKPSCLISIIYVPFPISLSAKERNIYIYTKPLTPYPLLIQMSKIHSSNTQW